MWNLVMGGVFSSDEEEDDLVDQGHIHPGQPAKGQIANNDRVTSPQDIGEHIQSIEYSLS